MTLGTLHKFGGAGGEGTKKKRNKKNKNPPQDPPAYETKSEDLVTLILSFKFDASEEVAVFGSCGCRGDCPTCVTVWKP